MINEAKLIINSQKQQKLENKKQTLAQLSRELLVNQDKIEFNDMIRKLTETYPDELMKCVERGKEAFKSNPNRDFYVMSALNAQWYNPKLWKQSWMYTLECPRPYLNFTVFKYFRKSDELELLWCLPDRDTLNFYYENRKVANEQDWVLLKYCIAYKDGTLWKRMKALNQEDTKPSLIVHDLSQLKANA